MLQFWLDFISNLLRKDDSSQVAASRLKGAVFLDRLSVTPAMLEAIRNDVVKTISRYLVIDESAMTLAVQAQGRTVALAASIPVLRPRADAPSSMVVHPTISLGSMNEPEADPVRPADPVRASAGYEATSAYPSDMGSSSEAGGPSVRIIVQDRTRARSLRRRRQQQVVRRVPGERPNGPA